MNGEKLKPRQVSLAIRATFPLGTSAVSENLVRSQSQLQVALSGTDAQL